MYYEPIGPSAEDLAIMRLIDKQYTRTPFYGSRRMVVHLRAHRYEVNRKRVQRLMQQMGLEAIYPKPRLSANCSEHKVYPYLMRGVRVDRPDQVWSADITYIVSLRQTGVAQKFLAREGRAAEVYGAADRVAHRRGDAPCRGPLSARFSC